MSYWPIRGDYEDHRRWFKEKNPAKSDAEAVAFAQQQIDCQLRIGEMNLQLFRSWMEQDERAGLMSPSLRVQWRQALGEQEALITRMRAAQA